MFQTLHLMFEAQYNELALAVDLIAERIRSSRIAANVFPKARLIYKVTTQKEFKETVNQFYGAESADTSGDIGEMLAGMDDDYAMSFAVGGYCPGTCVVAVGEGRRDAWFATSS